MGKMGIFLAHKDRVLSEILILWIDEKMLKLFWKQLLMKLKFYFIMLLDPVDVPRLEIVVSLT